MGAAAMLLGGHEEVAVESWYTGAYAAWQPFGAANITAAHMDLVGSNDLVDEVAPATWTASDGLVLNNRFNYMNLLDGGPFTFVRVGRLLKKTSYLITSTASYGGFVLYETLSGISGGANSPESAVSDRFLYVLNANYVNGDLCGFAYRKNADMSQTVFLLNHTQGTALATVSKAGTAYTITAMALWAMVYGLRAAGVWRSALSDPVIESILSTAITATT